VRILVTGATGFVGTRLRDDLANTVHEVINVTRAAPPEGRSRARHQWIQMDLAARLATPTVTRVDAVVYLAQSRAYREFPAKAPEIFAVNATALLWMLDWARSVGVRSFVYASSANVYRPSTTPLTETTPLEPQSFYGRSKQIGEMLVASYTAYFQCTVFRLFTVYGEAQSAMLIPSLVERVRNRRAIQLHGTAGLFLSPLYVGDASHFLKAAIEAEGRSEGAHVFNLGGPEHLNLQQIGDAIGEALGQEPIFERVGGPEPAGFLADSTRLAAAFGSTPAITFREGIRRTLGLL
jgi:UDP-glucose 4-epimerase